MKFIAKQKFYFFQQQWYFQFLQPGLEYVFFFLSRCCLQCESVSTTYCSVSTPGRPPAAQQALPDRAVLFFCFLNDQMWQMYLRSFLKVLRVCHYLGWRWGCVFFFLSCEGSWTMTPSSMIILCHSSFSLIEVPLFHIFWRCQILAFIIISHHKSWHNHQSLVIIVSMHKLSQVAEHFLILGFLFMFLSSFEYHFHKPGSCALKRSLWLGLCLCVIISVQIW